eukprot:g1562.t1
MHQPLLKKDDEPIPIIPYEAHGGKNNPSIAASVVEEKTGADLYGEAVPNDPGVRVCCLCCCPQSDGNEAERRGVAFPLERPCTDAFFAFFWLLSFVITVGTAIWQLQKGGFEVIRKDFFSFIPGISNEAREHGLYIGLFAFGLTIIGILSVFLLLTYPVGRSGFCTRGCFVRFSVLMAGALLIGLAVLSAFNGNFVLMIFMLFFAGALFYVIYSLLDRLPFSLTLIGKATQVVWRFKALFVYSMFSSLLQLAWMATCFGCFVAIMESYKGKFKLCEKGDEDPKCDPPAGLAVSFIALFFSYIWTSQLIMYSLTYASAFVGGSYIFFRTEYRSPHHENQLTQGICSRKYPSLAAFRYGATNNLGTLGLASFFIALVETAKLILRIICEKLFDNAQYADFIINCIFSCIEGALEYLNRYVIVYSAIYGVDFVEAAKQFDALLLNSGLQEVYNSEITNIITFMSSIMISLSVAFATYGFAFFAYGVPSFTYVGLFSGLFSFFAAITALQSLSAIVSTIFICFLHGSTNHLSRNHPKFYDQLKEDMTRAKNFDFGSWPIYCFCV